MQQKRFLRRIVIFTLSLLFVLFVSEIITGKFLPQKTFDSAYKDAISCFEEDDTVLFKLKPKCSFLFENFDTGEKFKVTTNNSGYRGSDFESVKKKGEKRILVEGDSFVLGFGVKDDEVFTNVLEKRLNEKAPAGSGQTSVINAGYQGGFGPDGYFLHLKTRGMMLEPDMVIFSIFVYNDFTDLENSEWFGEGIYGEPDKITSRKVRIDGNGYLLPIDIPFIYRLKFFRNSHLAVWTYNGTINLGEKFKTLRDLIYYKFVKWEAPSGKASDSNFWGTYFSNCIFGDNCHRKAEHLFSDLTGLIKASKQITDRAYNDGVNRFVVLIIPSDFQIYSDVIEKYKTDTGIPYHPWELSNPNPQRKLKEFFDKEGIKYIDLLPLIREQEEERLYYQKDGHFNPKGHAFTAGVIYNWIRENYGSISAN